MPRSANCDRLGLQRSVNFQNLQNKSPVILLPEEGGLDLSSELTLWRKVAESEMRVWLMSELSGLRVGLPEVEQFGINIEEHFKSKKFKSDKEKEAKAKSKLVSVVMEIKLNDEKEYLKELNVEANRVRKSLGEKFTKKIQKPTEI